MLGRLYLVVTPRPGWSMAEVLDRTERALAGGVEVVQLRAKDWEARPILDLGERMLALARRYGVPFFLNDRPDLAALLGADGVHLGQGDLTPAEARRFFQGMVGRSTHAPEQALRALEEGVDYLSIGPVWETPTKPGRQAAGLGYVRWARENLGERPWYAIGGITLENLGEVLEAGARRVVVVRAILDAENPERAAQAFRERLYGVA
ncbi:thiamine phosphate synthase [Thermus scotoductus]|uniref:Thiamine-phosphate synthase n=1 Tax=Thermus scotoductus TaxID=37636 RepID=A0A430UWS6_THESC|nr:MULTISPECIES: thiamine phosphate synthase [Thermus]RTH39315.1 thiamine phosphate synthase [Thermus scotoductus]RTI13774.1 thiamine phosphate synthase [Thermus scotoductus]ULR39754.1 thiamine phosphate synthase [Thermus sp. NEB1569]